MNRFKHHFENHFTSCRLLAHAHDQHRHRDVRLYMLPGEFDLVGVTDGTDTWVAPVRPELFSVNVLKIMQDIRLGIDVKPNEPRQRVVVQHPISATPEQPTRLRVQPRTTTTERVHVKPR